ncbi:hypothetical protein SDC9_76066 [bioreactor metagenome]|uniref:Uncharacterized protein n=1 Tax=bioreactor metagenome TaxID=1076179 RepID=A0A644YLZ9_9ZZZZ
MEGENYEIGKFIAACEGAQVILERCMVAFGHFINAEKTAEDNCEFDSFSAGGFIKPFQSKFNKVI